jgi:hypothetical protein
MGHPTIQVSVINTKHCSHHQSFQSELSITDDTDVLKSKANSMLDKSILILEPRHQLIEGNEAAELTVIIEKVIHELKVC